MPWNAIVLNLRSQKMQVEFKSIPEYFIKEKSGRKSNTIRDYNSLDKRHKLLIEGRAETIMIKNTETKETFVRKITDVCFFKGMLVISWKHNSQNHREKSTAQNNINKTKTEINTGN